MGHTLTKFSKTITTFMLYIAFTLDGDNSDFLSWGTTYQLVWMCPISGKKKVMHQFEYNLVQHWTVNGFYLDTYNVILDTY